MTQDEERVIKPPIDHITSGRTFQPLNAFLYKKMLKVGIILFLIWSGLSLLFVGFANPVFLENILDLFQPIELLVIIGWETTNFVYATAVVIFVVVGSVYTFIYIRRIEYSAVGWSGNAMPFIYTHKGIINITKKHVPFRTIVNVRTRAGPFDRMFGIGSVLIETAGGSTGTHAANLTSLLIQRLTSNAFEEKIEGIKFYEELRDFILREMRNFGRKPLAETKKLNVRRKKRVFSRDTLNMFIEIRDALRESKRSGGISHR
ncbi:MAG: PH domain-containing protein [Candidatus Thorarchaeota archaeon]|nr:PH domain-containing protein [Candidatus Thorarchaeota archaeon]